MSDHSRILQYYLECLKAEAAQSIAIPESSGKALKIVSRQIMNQLNEFFFGNEPYADIPFQPEWEQFNRNRLSKHKDESIYLAPKYCFKRQTTKQGLEEEAYSPLYFTEIRWETRSEEKTYRLSKLSHEPSFNFNFLPENLSMEERSLIQDEIQKIETWADKINRYQDELNVRIEKWIRPEPFIFISGSVDASQSSLVYEIESIQKNYNGSLMNTALRFFLETPNISTQQKEDLKFIEVANMNSIQSEIVKTALSQPFTVITGPPGTGKSQIVLNLLANLALNQKTVLFASKNNKAVNSVIEKLEEIQKNYCPFVRIGNKHEKSKGFDRIIKSLEGHYPEFESKIHYRDIYEISKKIELIQNEIKNCEKAYKNEYEAIQNYEKEKQELPKFLHESLCNLEEQVPNFEDQIRASDQEKIIILRKLNHNKNLQTNFQNLCNNLQNEYIQVKDKLPTPIKNELETFEINHLLNTIQEKIEIINKITNESNQKINDVATRIKSHNNKRLSLEAEIMILSEKIEICEGKIIEAHKIMLTFEKELPKFREISLNLEYEFDTIQWIKENIENQIISKELDSIMENLYNYIYQLPIIDQENQNKIENQLQEYANNHSTIWKKLNHLFKRDNKIEELIEISKSLKNENAINQHDQNFELIKKTLNLFSSHFKHIFFEIERGSAQMQKWMEARKRIDNSYLQLQQLQMKNNPHEELFIKIKQDKENLIQKKELQLHQLSKLNEDLNALNMELNNLLVKSYPYEKMKFLNLLSKGLQTEFCDKIKNLTDLEIFAKWNKDLIRLKYLFQEIYEKQILFEKGRNDLNQINQNTNTIQTELNRWLAVTSKTISQWPSAFHKIIGFDGCLDRVEEFDTVFDLSLRFFGKIRKIFGFFQKITEARRKLNKFDNLNSYEQRISNYKSEITKKSIAYFNQNVYEKIHEKIPEFSRNIKDFFNNWKDSVLRDLFNEIKKSLSIFITTNLSTRYNIPNTPSLFDYVIIDEASQNDIASVLPLLFRGKNLIIIGDNKQLKHISALPNRTAYQLADTYLYESEVLFFEYNKNSAFDLAERRYLDATNNQSIFMLRDHYRCHQEIVDFSNFMFYGSKLHSKGYKKPKTNISPLIPGIDWISVKGRYENKQNYPEARRIVEYVQNLYKMGFQEKGITLGIITPFRNQEILLRDLLIRAKINQGTENDWVMASTVHKFQGDEKDIIIYSPVFSDAIQPNTMKWLDQSKELLNVAVTRARSALIIIGDDAFCSTTNELHCNLLNYCKKIIANRGTPLIESDTERFFYNKLREHKFDFNYQVNINAVDVRKQYRLDFVLKKPDGYLVIELDGKQHLNQASYDHSRNEILKDLGYEVIRYTNDQIVDMIDTVIISLKKICLVNSDVP